MANQMAQWVIYDHPADHPEHVVVRRWTVGPNSITADSNAHLCKSVEAARLIVFANYPGAYWMPRSPEDDPSIIEVWI